jgi:nicotinamide mononucleotide adenylyltransferase
MRDTRAFYAAAAAGAPAAPAGMLSRSDAEALMRNVHAPEVVRSPLYARAVLSEALAYGDIVACDIEGAQHKQDTRKEFAGVWITQVAFVQQRGTIASWVIPPPHATAQWLKGINTDPRWGIGKFNPFHTGAAWLVS